MLFTLPATKEGGVDFARLLDAIDRQTRVVVVSHVLYRDSTLLDAEALARRCREVGAMLVLDVYQSAGVVPLELDRWGVDAAVGGAVKWLCGGPGASFLYVRPGLADLLEPTAHRLAGRRGAVRLPSRAAAAGEGRLAIPHRHARVAPSTPRAPASG